MYKRRIKGRNHKPTYKKLTAITTLMVFLICLSYTTPIANALTTTFTGNGNTRTLTEAGQKTFTGSQRVNTSTFPFGIPTSPLGWEGYRLCAAVDFNNTNQFISDSEFSTGAPWWSGVTQPQGNDASNMSAGYSSTNPGGTTTGVGYNTLTGKTVERTSTQNALLKNQNFSTPVGAGNWSIGKTGDSGGTGTRTISRMTDDSSSGSIRMYSYFSSSTGTRYATFWLNQTFTYDGLPHPDVALLTYSMWVPIFYFSSSSITKNVWYEIAIENSTTRSIVVQQTQITQTSSQPVPYTSAPSSANIANYLTAAGTYKITIRGYIWINHPSRATSQIDIRWDNIGIYARYGKFNSGSKSYVSQSINFGKSTLTANLRFWYWTNMSTMAPASDSNITVWVYNGVNTYAYTVTSFQSALKNQWSQIDWVLQPSMINNQSTISIRLGLIIGQNLLITKNTKYSVLFDNVTLTVTYEPLPQEVKLSIYDQQKDTRTPLSGSAVGEVSFVLNPSPSGWTPNPSFRFEANCSQVKVTYTITLNVRRTIQTIAPDLLFRSDRSTGNWTFSYTIPDTSEGTPGSLSYKYYNLNITVPNEWSIVYVKYAATDKTSLCSLVTANSTTKVLRVPDGVFGGENTLWSFALEVRTSSPNYLFPPGSIVTQVNATPGPNPGSWTTASYFYPGNYTRLRASLRNSTGGTGGIPDTSATVILYNITGSAIRKSWSSVPVDSDCNVIVQVSWDSSNVTSSGAETQWYFEVRWTNGYAAANRYVNFTTDLSKSPTTPTTLEATPTNFLGDNSVPFNDTVSFYVMYINGYNGLGIPDANVTWKWVGNTTYNNMDPGAVDGKYTATIGRHEIAEHYGLHTINVTASKSGYAKKTIFIDINVRPVKTSLYIVSPFTPNPVPWSNTSSLRVRFYDIDHSTGISSNVVMKVNETTPGFSSYITCTSQQDGYFIININSSFADAGSHSYVINVTAARWHYQNSSLPSFPTLTVRDRLTTHIEPSLSVTTPYGDNATFLITYKDVDAGGAIISGPGGIATYTWQYGSSIPGTLLPNGTYEFTVNVAGKFPGNYSLTFSFSKTHWTPINITNALVQVRYIHTSLSSPTTQLSMYWGDNATSVLTYKDIDHNSKINFASWDSVKTYDVQTGIVYDLAVYNIFLNPDNTWTLRLNATLREGNYTLRVHAYVLTASGYYDDKWFYPTLTIKPILASSSQVGAVLSVVWSDTGKIVVKYNDTYGRLISGASIEVSISDLVSWSFYDNGSGVYTIFFNTTGATESAFGYSFSVYLSKVHYTSSTVTGDLLIRAISTTVQITAPEPVTRGNNAVFQIRLFDTDHNVGITNATITIVGLNSTYYTVTELGGGNYTVTLKTDWASEGQKITFTVSPQKDHYSFQGVLVTYNLVVPGVSPMWVLIAGGGGGGAVFLVALGVYLYRRAKIPFVIKKINETLSLINKGGHEQAIPVPLKTREESIDAITEERIDAFVKRKPAPGAPPIGTKRPTKAAVEEAAPAAASAEVEAALKKELKAVEPGKPEEEIEEVEMETLDEELGRLEKLDTGQEAPEDAKQVRDVIEQYNKQKKKR